MRRARHVAVLVVCLLLGAVHAAERRPLAPRINVILGEPGIARGYWGIQVVSLNTGEVLYSLNADKLFIPASNTKLFTTAAALALIGPNSSFAPRLRQRERSTSTGG